VQLAKTLSKIWNSAIKQLDHVVKDVRGNPLLILHGILQGMQLVILGASVWDWREDLGRSALKSRELSFAKGFDGFSVH
jgi:hypothetical protein